MTTWQAGAAVFTLNKPNRHLIGPKGDLVGDVFRVLGCMCIMTCLAGTTLGGLVDVYKVQVLVTVAEARQRGCFCVFY